MRKQVVIIFFLFSILGGLALMACRVIANYLLAARFSNDRFLLSILSNFENASTTAFFIMENIVISCIISLYPCIYVYQMKKLPGIFVASYSCTLYFISAMGTAIYLNLARVTLPVGPHLHYVLFIPFLYVIVPIWFTYFIYFCVDWIAQSEIRS